MMRREGRIRAFRKALERCGALKAVRGVLEGDFLAAQFRDKPQRMRAASKQLAPAQVEALRNTPEAIAKRQQRGTIFGGIVQ
jgi:hypothetical protein